MISDAQRDNLKHLLMDAELSDALRAVITEEREHWERQTVDSTQSPTPNFFLMAQQGAAARVWEGLMGVLKRHAGMKSGG